MIQIPHGVSACQDPAFVVDLNEKGNGDPPRRAGHPQRRRTSRLLGEVGSEAPDGPTRGSERASVVADSDCEATGIRGLRKRPSLTP